MLDLQDKVKLTVFLGISIQTKRLPHGVVAEGLILVSPLTSMLGIARVLDNTWQVTLEETPHIL